MVDKGNAYKRKSKEADANRAKRDAQAAGKLAVAVNGTADQEEQKESIQTVNKGGRPRTATNRIAFTLKVKQDVRKRLKQAALDHDCTASDIVDALVEQYMPVLDWDKVGK